MKELSFSGRNYLPELRAFIKRILGILIFLRRKSEKIANRITMLLIRSPITAVTLQPQQDANRKLYAPDLIKVKLKALEAVSRQF